MATPVTKRTEDRKGSEALRELFLSETESHELVGRLSHFNRELGRREEGDPREQKSGASEGGGLNAICAVLGPAWAWSSQREEALDGVEWLDVALSASEYEGALERGH
jgi:hypothetical protein